MDNIWTKQYQMLADHQRAWELLVKNYAPRMEQGMAAPFFEYAITSSWMDTRYLHCNRLWMEGQRAVAFVYYENPPACIFFSLLPGYEALADEMIAWADENMPGTEKEKELIFFSGQQALIEAAKKRGYQLAWQENDWMLNLEKHTLDTDLPPGFHFVDPLQADPVKLARCTWKGFDHEEKGVFSHWNDPVQGEEWTPQRAYLGIISSIMAPPPHATHQYNVIIADEEEEYACFSGMWWVQENRLAYMEPLCTIPKYRGRGLAKAALSMHCRRLVPLGACYMTGGGDPFYEKIGYQERVVWMHFKKNIL